VNLMSVDTEHIQGVTAYLWSVWSSPLQVILILISKFLFNQLLCTTVAMVTFPHWSVSNT